MPVVADGISCCKSPSLHDGGSKKRISNLSIISMVLVNVKKNLYAFVTYSLAGIINNGLSRATVSFIMTSVSRL